MMQKQRAYLELLKIFVQIVEASKGTGADADDRMLDAEGLALKFFAHASAAFHLYQGTILPQLGANFIDASSINVLGRAVLETFLVFHHIFVSPVSGEERDFRYMSWKLAGLIERQTLPAQSPKGEAMLLEEAQLIAPLQGKLKDNQYFKALNTGQQKELLEKGQWKFPSWKTMALAAGLSRTHAEAFYSYLCEYAHAGNLSVF